VINCDFQFGSIFLNKAVPVIASCDTAYYRHTGRPPNTICDRIGTRGLPHALNSTNLTGNIIGIQCFLQVIWCFTTDNTVHVLVGKILFIDFLETWDGRECHYGEYKKKFKAISVKVICPIHCICITSIYESVYVVTFSESSFQICRIYCEKFLNTGILSKLTEHKMIPDIGRCYKQRFTKRRWQHSSSMRLIVLKPGKCVVFCIYL